MDLSREGAWWNTAILLTGNGKGPPIRSAMDVGKRAQRVYDPAGEFNIITF